MLSRHQAKEQIIDVLKKYPKMKLVEENDHYFKLSGLLAVNMRIDGFSLSKEYECSIYIPFNSNKLPYVKDDNNEILRTYPHIYSNGILCLETDTKIRLRFINGFNFLEWIEEYVELYFLSYEYYQTYGVYPFGERNHGWVGILETYMEVLDCNDMISTLYLMNYISKKKYRGHLLCPCKSGKKIRNCHGDKMINFYKDYKMKSIFRDDYIKIKEGVEKCVQNMK